MKVKPIYKFQEGGPVPAEAPMEGGAPMEGQPGAGPEAQGGNPEEAIAQIAGQLVDMLMQQVQDPQAVAAILQAALEMVSQAAAPAQPTYQRRGGRLVRIG